MSVNSLLQNLPTTAPVLQATFGLERESLRMNSATHRVAQTPHPTVLGNRSYHPYIQTDFSESQLELITPVASSTKEARRFLTAITDVAGRSINRDEYLWPLSMPPQITEEEIRVALLENTFEQEYRNGLVTRYGKKLQAISGIHYNIELGPDLVAQLFETSDYTDLVAFKNDLYLKLAQNYLRFRWLLTYLYGASPLAEADFTADAPSEPVRSMRNSHQYGYVNDDEIQVSFASLEQYISDIEGYVASGQLSAEKEFYSSVRLRGSKHNRDYLTRGITYMEFRNFDLNPFDNVAISQETLDTVHLFLLALLWLDDVAEVDQALRTADQLNEAIALAHPLTALPEEAPLDDILSAMKAVVIHFKLDEYAPLIEQVENAIADPTKTVAGRLLAVIDQHSLEKFGREKGQAYHDYAWQAHYALKGFETMELSTQMLLVDGLQKGVHFEILDENDQFLKLWHGGHVEYVKNGNMTAKDSYIVPLAMENKTVTKKILAKAGYPVPAGDEFASKADALRYYNFIADKAIVVKPKSTNFGLGISIFQEPASLVDYEKALDIAFAEDSDVLVEEFIPGTEYRFFVLDGKCEAVLLRVAANVVGDGTATIRELVDRKNQNPLRGRDHRSPLEIINLGDIELLMLEQQGYTPDTVLPAGEKAVLRGNSNISTGGDSIDVTERMHDSYKQLAAGMANAMGAWVCGVDLIIPDASQPSTAEFPGATCIETNFNPSMYMHTYCQEGPGQQLTPKILAKLFPEI